MKKILLFISLIIIISACSSLPFLNGGEKGPFIPNESNQFPFEALASSAYGGTLGQNTDDQSPYAATGAPDVNSCIESEKAWTPREQNHGEQWIELTYWDKVYVSKIKVYETFNPGTITKIELKNGSDYFTMWKGSYDIKRACPYTFETSYEYMDNLNITWSHTPFMTDTVRVTIDTDLVKGWNEIDSVELFGYEEKWHFFNETLYIG